MNSRQRQILIHLFDKDAWIKGKELSKVMGVTDRTIRSDIEHLNHEYKQIIQSSTREGYKINKKVYHSLLSADYESIPQTPEERRIYIIKSLLFNQQKISLIDLQEQLFVSEYTIEGDIKKIREIIQTYEGLKLKRQNNQLFFQGNEHIKRKVYRDLLTNEIQGNFLNLNKVAALYKKFDLLKVITIFEDVLQSYNYDIRQTAIPMIVVHIGITIERMLSRNYLDYRDLNKKVIDTIEYEISKTFFEKVTKNIQIEDRQEEVVGLATILMGYKNAYLLKEEVEFEGKFQSIPNLLEEIVSNIQNNFDLDFSKDEDFKNGLHLHIQSLINRIRNHVSISNVHLQEIKKTYPLIFEMGIHIGQLIGDYFGFDISESEAGFIALHIGAAYDRLSVKHKYQVLMITPHNQSLSKLTKGKITNMFKERIEIRNISDYFIEEEVANGNFDLIISTLPIQHELDIMTIQISLFLNHEDESKIFSALNELDKRRFLSEFGNYFGTLIDERFYFSDLELETPQEVIEYMSNKLLEERIVSPDFKDSVLAREVMSSTSFAYSIAIPHPFNLASHQSKIAISILKKPITWDNYPVQVVMLLAIREEDSEIMWLFFDWLSETITNTTRMTNLLKSKNRNQFVHWMMND